MWKKWIFLSAFIILLTLGVSGCDSSWFVLPTETPLPPTMTATATLEPTATRDWFPATATNTPVKGEIDQTPTQDLRPIDNPVILTDDFSEENGWETINTNSMVAVYGQNELSLALREAKGTVYSFNSNPIPDDYYLELGIEPNLCTGEDHYGLAFRTQSKQDFYRVMISCQGNIRLDLVRGSGAVRLVETQQYAPIFSGPDASIKLNVWLVDNGVKIYINDVLQLEYYKLQWYAGGIGVFARSAGENALSVSFNDLNLREVNPLPPTPIPSLTATPD